MSWTLARRAERLNPSLLREILKATDRPGVISLAGGLPAADLFPVEAVAAASARVLREAPRQALQYAASEGLPELREWVAQSLRAQGAAVDAGRVLITTGSQQGLDLAAKVLVDAGRRVAVETPTYLGALQALAPFEPAFVALEGDDEGPDPQRLWSAVGARLLYLQPNFRNPSGGSIGHARRDALLAECAALGLPVVEDDPYGALWYDAPPPAPLLARDPQRVLHLGSFSKVLAPGLRLGWLVAPDALYPKLLQAKQAADLHTPGFTQRIAARLLQDGVLDRHLPRLRERYRAQRDAMAAALERHLGALRPLGARWQLPAGGMFFWLQLPPGLDTAALLPAALEAGVAFVPGAAFFAQPAAGAEATMRLSFATVPPAELDLGVERLAAVLRPALAASATRDESGKIGLPA